MTEIIFPQADGESLVVDLKNPYLAALLAWLIPGAGHVYQHRFGKAALFFVCVIGTFCFGMGLGRGRAVYASAQEDDYRVQYVAQVACGVVALPAVIQAIKTHNGGDPFWVLCERYPADYRIESMRFKKIDTANPLEIVPDRFKTNFNLEQELAQIDTLKDGLMARPPGPVRVDQLDTMAMWHYDYRHDYDMGVLFTIVAGLLNLMAIYDAFVGPAIFTKGER